MFTLVHNHKSYTLTELENMVPWEYDLVVSQVNSWVKEETEKQKNAAIERDNNMKKTLQSINRKRK
jgi:hypothetical protein